MAKATHTGTCQICGRPQKLPSDMLAKHGYKVAGYGFFVGTCHGSDSLPYEKSCDLLPPMIEKQKGIVANLKVSLEKDFPVITDINTVVLANLAFTIQSRYTARFPGDTKVIRVPAKIKADYTNPEGTYSTYSLVPADESSYDHFQYAFKAYRSYDSDPLMVLNRAQSILRKEVVAEIANRQEWIDWAEDRVAKWVPDAPLHSLTKEEQVVVDGKVVRDLNKFEKNIMADVAKYAKEGVFTINNRRSYYVKNTITFKRVQTLVADGFLKLISKGSNKDGDFMLVSIN